MIEINLLPGARRKTRKAGSGGPDVRALLAQGLARVKDPFLIAAVASWLVCLGVVAFMFLGQRARAEELAERETKAVRDSTRFASVIAEQEKATAQRDSVNRQLEIIKAIDNNRFVWAHLLDETSRSLPEYTWITSIGQNGAMITPATQPAAGQPPITAITMPFRLSGITVDIQALTRFMRLLEASPFIQNVQLSGSQLVQMEGKDVTRFDLDASYQMPDSSAVRTEVLSLKVR